MGDSLFIFNRITPNKLEYYKHRLRNQFRDKYHFHSILRDKHHHLYKPRVKSVRLIFR